MIFLRHPTPDVAPGTCYGRTDLDITDASPKEIETAIKLTPRLTRIYSSPALRCRKLSLPLAEAHGLEVRFDERLWEMHMGEWEGIAWKAIDRKLSDHWLEDPINHPTPGGEAFKDLQQRVLALINELNDGQMLTTAIVCHAGPIRAVQMAWNNMSFDEVFAKTPGYATPIRITPPSS